MSRLTKGQSTLRKLLMMKTGCGAQYKGFPCNTCFHSMELGIENDKLHELWEATLLYRGDYTTTEIPMTKEEMMDRINQLTNLLRADLGTWLK